MSTLANTRKHSGRGRHHNVSGTNYVNAPMVHGKWEKTHWTTFRCSVCKMEQVEKFHICPMCKAVMDK